MNKTALAFVIIPLGVVVLAGVFGGINSNSDSSGAILEIQTCGNRCGIAPFLLLADRTDTKDRIIYGTDSDMERAMEDQEKMEREKEENAWRMLQNMNLYDDYRRKPHDRRREDIPRN